MPNSEFALGKGVLQSEVLGEVCVLEGGSSGQSFSRSLARSVSRSFRACLAGTFGAKRTSARISGQKSHASAQQKPAKIEGKSS